MLFDLRMRRACLGFLGAFYLVFIFTSPASAQTFSFKDEAGKHLDILRDGKPLVRYMYAFDTSTPELRHETYKVYHHVFDPTGERLLTKGAGGKFTHHRGLFIGFARTEYQAKTYDLWHMKNQCSLVHQKVVTQEASEGSATLTTLIHWDIEPGKPIIAETRTVKLSHDEGAHVVIDWHSELKAVAGDVVLKADPEHGGMQYRPANAVADNKSAKYLFHEEGIDPKKVKDLPWVTLTYELDGKKYSVQDMRAPSNPGNSVYSAYRDYGRFGNYFVKPIADGETLKLSYRFRIAEGDAEPRAVYAKHYQEFVKGQ